MQQPPVIRYNLKERGRQYRGQERHFDIPRIVDSINGPATQERVQTRAMLGFFGHWPRLKFGLEPAEGGVVDGAAQAIEPAVVTVHLHAFDDGTIEHRTEFLDTSSGQLAARMHANRVGGFSSAIDPSKPELYGFDYVNDPNYSTNRGYDLMLDSVTSGQMTFDDILLAEQAEHVDAVNRLFAALEASLRLALDSSANFERENVELMDLVARREAEIKALQSRGTLLDSAASAASALERERRLFRETELPRFQDTTTLSREIDATYERLMRQWGR
jgi:hypothetical protein